MQSEKVITQVMISKALESFVCLLCLGFNILSVGTHASLSANNRTF